ncbi:DUF3597 domain-containing protein [Variovorax sp. PBL-E5]|uniref:DUF3597 domain-containing protein n=1 Tax=Variovorax sp. PBL-E5 TaxID=434014 RepID=UPI001318C439|nr:DUF3597 domain-containing protein [Variovorax sp. PBL-E5]VTU20364.1 hypothetical protein E5CHR_00971 [Variovorax sp. PBL-E5]
MHYSSWRDYSLSTLIGMGLRREIDMYDSKTWWRIARSHKMLLEDRHTPISHAAPWGPPNSQADLRSVHSLRLVHASPQPAITLVDVEALLDGMRGAQALNWRTSIVDLMKLLGLDSGLEVRRQLAAELSYRENTSDTAKMNIWLHRQVMTRLAANGGKVPSELRD